MKSTTRLIEQIFPVQSISQSCKREKSIRQGHLSTLQTWWARRPLAVCRSTIFLSLLPDLESLQTNTEVMQMLETRYPYAKDLEDRLLIFTSELSDFKNSNNDDLINTAKRIISLTNSNPSLADTFSGGGSIPLEAIRLGLRTYASDLNPVATTGLSLVLELAPGISRRAIVRLNEDIQAIAKSIRNKIANIYPEPDVLAYFWGRTYQCKDCGNESPLIQSKWLSKTRLKRAIRIKANRKTGKVTFSIFEPITKQENIDSDTGTINGRSATCVFCCESTSTDEIQEQGIAGQLGEIVYAKYVSRGGTKDYAACLPEESSRLGIGENRPTDGLSIDFNLPLDLNGIRHLWAIQYGIRTVGDLFNARQLVAIKCIASAIYRLRNTIEESSSSKQEAQFRYIALVMILNKVAIYSNRHSWWQSNGAFPANIFVRQAIPMVWNYVEIPPHSQGAGGWYSSSKWIIKALEHLSLVGDTAIVKCADAASSGFPKSSIDLVVIDPPYFDSITYSYLSDFFYPWMKKLLEDMLPSWFENSATPKRDELIVDRKHKLAPSPKDADFFTEKMTHCLTEARRILTRNGIIVLMYGHKDLSAWVSLFRAFAHAGLRVTTSWPIHTERSSKFRHGKVEALGASCVLVLRPSSKKTTPYLSMDIEQFRSQAQIKISELRNRHPELTADSVAFSMAVFPIILDDYMNSKVTDSVGKPLSIEQLLEIATG